MAPLFLGFWDKSIQWESDMILPLRRQTSTPTWSFFQKNLQKQSGAFYFFGVPGIEPGLHPPQGCGLPLSYTPIFIFSFNKSFLHFVQAKIFFPEGSFTGCKFGFCIFLPVGLYFPLSFFLLKAILDFFPQISHCFAI